MKSFEKITKSKNYARIIKIQKTLIFVYFEKGTNLIFKILHF